MDKEYRIGKVTGGMMIALALIIDGVQFLLTLTVLLLPLSLFLTFFAAIMFGIWFALCGVNYFSKGGKKLAAALAATVTELIPFINAIPATTLGVAAILVLTRAEDMRESKGRKASPRTAAASARLERTRAAQAKMRDHARAERESRQQSQHPAADTDILR